MNRSEKIRFLILRSIGNFLVLFMLFGFVATFGPAVYYEISFKIIEARGVQFSVPQPETTGFGEILKIQKSPTGLDEGFGAILSGPKQQILIPKDTYFSILIPKIGASSKIFANVDPSSANDFLPILKQGVAHAKGSVFPGMKGNVYLFAHSTDNFWDVGRYNAVFYLLKNLVKDDQIVIFFQNKRFDYKVTEVKIVEANDVSYLLDSQKGDEETLILQTCWPPGTTWKRLVIVAKPK